MVMVLKIWRDNYVFLVTSSGLLFVYQLLHTYRRFDLLC